MPRYAGLYGNTASTERTGYYDIGGGGTGTVGAKPTPEPTPTDPTSDPFRGPGSLDFDPTNPAVSAQELAKESGDVFTGFKAWMFGSDKPDKFGKHGGLLNVGDALLVGDALRFGSEVVANVVGGVVGGVTGAVGGVLERIPATGSKITRPALQSAFDALPDKSKSKQDAIAAMEKDQGLFGTGILSADDHLMAKAIADFEKEKIDSNTSLYGGLFVYSASIADTMTNLFGAMGAGTRVVERGAAGWTRASGMNQLEMIMAVGGGQAVWTQDDQHLTDVEQVVYDNYKSGKWSPEVAMDYMASHGAGFSHDKRLQVLSEIFLDPLNAATFGAGALAKFGKTGVELVNLLKNAREGLQAAKAELAVASLGEKAAAIEKVTQFDQLVLSAQEGIRSGLRGENVATRDVLGKIATQKWTGDLARKYGEVYQAMGATSVGKMAKITRTIIDPLHAWGSSPRALAALDEGSRQVTEAVVSVHGEFTHIDNIQALHGLAGGEDFKNLYEQGLAVYAANTLRRVVGRSYRAAQMLGGRSEQLLGEGSVLRPIADAMKNVQKRALVQLEEEANKYVRTTWNEADIDNLAGRLADLWGGGPDDVRAAAKKEWIAEFADRKKWNPAQMSLLHSASYGTAVRQLHDARAAVIANGETGVLTDKLHRLVLLNKQTLTDLGAEGILTRLSAAPTLEAKLAEVEASKFKYPELRNFVGDPTSAQKTIDDFENMVKNKKNFLPGQISDAERPKLPASLVEFDQRTRNVFTIGFRPDDEFLWALQRDSEGVLREVGDPWIDQISDRTLQGYSPVREMSFNASGKPIVMQALGKASRMIDAAEAAAKIASHGVTGAIIAQSAKIKFTESVYRDFEAVGVSKTQVEELWQRLMKKVEDSDDISGVRGLSGDAIYRAAKEVTGFNIMRQAGLDARTLLIHVLDAYNGDVRHIGLTQKFTGKAKLLAAQATGANTLGQISEHVWPLLKFRMNPFFQLQEKIEPWVLNNMRGAKVAITGTQMSEVDHLTAELYRNFVDKNLIRMSDTDIAELAAKFGWGKALERESVQDGSRLAFMRGKIETLFDVQGVKQLGMLRTWQKGLGASMRKVWDENLPGEWQRMLDHERVLAGGLISEDEFAVRMASSNIHANRVFVERMMDGKGGLSGWQAQFLNSIKEGQWSAPQTLGELRALDLDHMAARLQLVEPGSGVSLDTSMKLRESLAAGRISMDAIRRALSGPTGLSAHPDYVQRVQSAFEFSWPKFWDRVQTTYGLTPDERSSFESMYAGFAQSRKMTPVEFMSQVYSPQITGGTDAAVGALGKMIEETRNGRVERYADLGKLVGEAGQSNVEDLYRQMGQIMAAHLDPSAKRAFLLDINPALQEEVLAGRLRFDMREVEEMFDSMGRDALSKRIMGYIQGTPGTSPHRLVVDETTGVESIRNIARTYLEYNNRPGNLQRVLFDDDPALGEEVADWYGRLTYRFQNVETAAFTPLVSHTHASMLAEARRSAHTLTGAVLKTEGTEGLSDSLKELYKKRADEVRALYVTLADHGHINMEFVNDARPYLNADELRADLANGTMKVGTEGLWHPVYTTTHMVMEKAVVQAYGYGREAVDFGSHHGMMSAAGMFSDESRALYISDEVGSQMWQQHSQEVLRQAEQVPTTVAGYEDRYGVGAARPFQYAGVNRLQTNTGSRSVGREILTLPLDQQTEMVTEFSQLRNWFPDAPMGGFNVVPDLGPTTFAITMNFGDEPGSIVFAHKAGWHSDAETARLAREKREYEHIRSPQNPLTYGQVPWTGPDGVPELAGDGTVNDIYHEFFHVIDHWLMLRGARAAGASTVQAAVYEDNLFTTFMEDFRRSQASMHLSRYANHTPPENANNYMKYAENFAELGAASFDPKLAGYVAGTAPDATGRFINPELQQYIGEFKAHLERMGVYVPNGRPVPVNPHAGMTVAEVNAMAAGRYVAPPAGFKAVNGTDFYEAVSQAAAVRKSNGRMVSETLYVYPEADYANMRTFLSEDGKTGYAIKPDGDLVSVFNVGEKGRIEAILPRLPGQGATKLDAFDESGRLPELYAKAGMQEVGRVPWDESQKPANWTGGTPDVVYMQRNPAPVREPTYDDAYAVENYAFNSAPQNFESSRLTAAFEAVRPQATQRTLYRSVDQSQLAVFRSRIGTGEHKYSSYMSTATTPDLARPYAGVNGTVIRIETPAGLRMIDMDSVMRGPNKWPHMLGIVDPNLVTGEMLLPRNLVYTVSEVNGEIVLTITPPVQFQQAVEPIRSERRAGLLPQELIDRITGGFIGNGRYAESNPDVARLAGFFVNHMNEATAHVFRSSVRGNASEFAHLFDHASGMHVTNGVPYNFTEARVWDTAVQSMASKWEDAFRLQYFAQNRSMFQRSLNHPMFGLYPASYMWGKIGPELIRFIAREPFGERTGAMLYSLADYQKAIGVQRQWDPEFDKTMNDLGNSAALSFAGFMLPATPWSLPSSYPAWMRDMAQQGLKNNAAANTGGVVEDNDFIKPLTDTMEKFLPQVSNTRWLGRAAEEVGNALPWNAPQPVSAPAIRKNALGQTVGGTVAPSPEVDLSQPVNATNSKTVLETQMQALRGLLSSP